MIRLAVGALLTAAVTGASVPAGRQQQQDQEQQRQQAAQEASVARMTVPFGVGELLEYDISFGKLHVGNGNMEILPMDNVRNRETWHTIFRINGGIRFVYTVHDQYEDWMDTQSLASLRYRQNIDEGSYNPKRLYEIYPDRREFVEVSQKDAEPQPSVARPLSDAAFLFALRVMPLRVGLDTTLNDYFKADANPIRFRVIRKDTIEVGAGRFVALVVQPTFASSRLFGEGGHAEIWLSDDANHIMLQMKSKLSFGSLNLYLKSYRPSPTTNVPLNRLP